MEKKDENVIYVGRKHISQYLSVALIKLQQGLNLELRARGNNVIKAVNLLEILKSKDNIEYSMDTETEKFYENNEERKVSAMIIYIKRKGG